MNKKNYDLLIFIGRFQPFHNGHLAVLRQGLARAGRLLVLVGSANQPRSIRNPFTAAERAGLIDACLRRHERRRVIVAPLADAPGDDAAWVGEVRRKVRRCLPQCFPGRAQAELRIGLIGHNKDAGSYYLALFPAWDLVSAANHAGIDATALRAVYLQHPPAAPQAEAFLAARVPAPVLGWLKAFATTPAYAAIKAGPVSADGGRRRGTARQSTDVRGAHSDHAVNTQF